MIKVLKNNWKEALKLLSVFIVLAYLSITISNWLRTNDMQGIIQHAGIWGPVVVVLYTVASHIFAPVAGMPATIVAFSAYGLVGGWFILYAASLLSSVVNFYISRELGRRWVRRLAGENSLNKIDSFAEIMGVKLLKIARIFGAPLFEFISYAAGFTQIGFKRYFLITMFYSILPSLLFAIAVYYSLSSAFLLMLFFIFMFTVGGLFSWYTVNKYLKFSKSKK